jgi:hypothetical protein
MRAELATAALTFFIAVSCFLFPVSCFPSPVSPPPVSRLLSPVSRLLLASALGLKTISNKRNNWNATLLPSGTAH